MHLLSVLLLSAVLYCDAKLPRNKIHIQPNELPSNPTQHAAAMRLIQTEKKSERTSEIVNQYKRSKREVFDSKSYEASLIWAHSERLDEKGDVVLRWVNTDSSITFRMEARTRGYVGLGFNTARNMRGADLLVAWVDDRHNNAQILDCHGLTFEDRTVADEVQNYELISGYQNETHTTVEFRRLLDTCDRQDFVIGEDTTQVLWALGPPGSDGELPRHVHSGSRPLRFLQPLSKPDIPLQTWDVRINKLKIPHVMATLFWCKVFKAPDLPKKHHIVGYQPLIDSRPIRDGLAVAENTPSPVHHMVLYECAEDDKRQWNEWAEGDGFYGPNRPAELATCVTPIAAWAIGSKGEFLPENVGIPLGERGGVSYYMLEVHYDNQELHDVLDSSGIRVFYTPALRKHDASRCGLNQPLRPVHNPDLYITTSSTWNGAVTWHVLDSSGIRVFYTPALRKHDGALFGTGIGISALHIIPPKQKAYRTVGICYPECTNSTMPEKGINIVSVLLHAHGTARKISLKHIRDNVELPRISEENSYDARYQQSRIVPGGRKFYKNDVLITECTYDSTSRDKPILGGYSASQEMCLSFVLYYPRTALAGCYSMSPVLEFFDTFGVKEFYGLVMMDVENIFLSSSNKDALPPEFEAHLKMAANSDETAKQGDDQGVGLMKSLVIKEPAEFRNKTFIAHINEMAWAEPLLTEQVERRLYDWHMSFCKRRDDTWGTPIQIHNYPNYTELPSNEASERVVCHYKSVRLPSMTTGTAAQTCISWVVLAICILLLR